MFRTPYLPLLILPLLALTACSGAGDLFTAAGVSAGGASAGQGGAAASAGMNAAAGAEAGGAAAGSGGTGGVVAIPHPNPPVTAGGAGGAPPMPAAGAGGASAGNGGNAGDAGGGGNGGAPPIVLPLQVEGVCKGKVVLAAAPVDDFEQGMNGWATYIDSQFGAPTLSAPGAALTAHAATFGGGWANVSGVYRDLRCNDVSAFTGISFWAKGRGGDKVRFLAVIPATQPELEGGDCDTTTMSCWDHPGKLFELSDQWQPYHVAWKDLAQYGWGTPATFAGVINSLLWINDGQVNSFEFSLDEVKLYQGDAP